METVKECAERLIRDGWNNEAIKVVKEYTLDFIQDERKRLEEV